jgi:hypothetical protein
MKLGKGKLGKLAMPKRDEVDMAELELEVEPSEGGKAGEMMAEEGAEEVDLGDEEAAPKSDALADVADEDLLAEVKKRGLMTALSEEAPAEKARDKAAGAVEQEDEMSEYA